MDKRYPTIVSTSPINYETDVVVNSALSLTFNIDLDSRYIDDYIYLVDAQGEKVKIQTTYQSKKIIVTPLASLLKNATYTLTAVGDSDTTDAKKEGVRSIIGDCMNGNYSVTFSTEIEETLDAPTILFPPNGSVIKEQPTFKWESINATDQFLFELSTSKAFSALVYPTVENQVMVSSELTLATSLEDGIYYFRVRHVNGEWSIPYQFNLSTLVAGTISEQDIPPIEENFPIYDDMPIELELIDSFPKESDLLIPTTVKNLYFRIIGDIDPTLLDIESLQLEGIHISGDEDESHGIVKGKTTIVEDTDGTSYIIFTPEPIPTEEEGAV